MGSRFKKTVISESVRKSLSKWQRRVKEKQSSSYELLNTSTTTSLESLLHGMDNSNHSDLISEIEEGSSSGIKDICHSNFDDVSMIQSNAKIPSYDEDYHDHYHDVKHDLPPPPLSWESVACIVNNMMNWIGKLIMTSSHTIYSLY